MSAYDRDRIIVRTSILGILANVFLAAFKAVTGILSHSIAIVLDAVNNLSDALSSVITIIGTKFAMRKPDREHPLGHGRAEYLSAMLVSAIVLYAGITAFIESVKKIIDPEIPDYSTAAVVILASAVIVKLLLGSYVKRKGEEVNSSALIASGSDARFDAVLSASVLLSALRYLWKGIAIEAYVGILISCFIIKAGVEMFRETIAEIIGKRADSDFTEEIRRTVLEEPLVSGAYDLILHNYGPDRYFGSVHVSVPDTMDAAEIDAMQRRITQNVFLKHGVIMTAIGIYSVNTKDEEIGEMFRHISDTVMKHPGVLQIHGFYADRTAKTVNLDIILDFSLPDREKEFNAILKEVQELYPDYRLFFTMDIDA